MTKTRWTADETDELLKLVELSGKNEGVKTFVELHPDRTEDSVRSKLRTLDVKEPEKKESYTKPESRAITLDGEEVTIHTNIVSEYNTVHEAWEEGNADPYYMDDTDIKDSWFRRFLNWLRGNR